MEYNDLAKIGILGLLEERESLTLSELQDLLQHSFERYWGFGRGVLNPTINRLVEEGLIDMSAGAEDRTAVYRLTDEGRGHLHELLRDAFSDREVVRFSNRDHFLIKLGFLHHLPAAEQEAIMADLADWLREERESLEEIQQRHREAELGEDTGYRQYIVNLNVQIVESYIEWIEDLEIRTLEGN